MSLALDVEYINRQIAFSEKTFGPGPRAEGVVDHIRKELEEILKDPWDLNEWCDVIILAIDGAWREGFPPEQIIAAVHDKLSKNEKRSWPDWRTAEPGKAIEHIRSEVLLDLEPMPKDPEVGQRAIVNGIEMEYMGDDRWVSVDKFIDTRG